MILYDLSQVSTFALMSASKTDGFEVSEHTARHLILNYIRETRRKYGKRFGDPVIATDGRKYWRRDIFPLYKYSRKKSREDSAFDWKEIHRCINVVKDELAEWFPYPVIQIDSAEADDIIAIMSDYTQTNDLNDDGLFSVPKETLIISSDTDFFQLHKHKNVRQMSPLTQKLVKPDVPLSQFVCEHILTGDSGDGIPSILSPDEFFKMKEDGLVARQKPVTPKIKQFYLEQIDRDGKVTEWRTEEEKKNYERNFRLVHFDAIPKSVRQAVIENYESQLPLMQRRRSRLMTYMVKKNMSNLLPNIGDF